MDRSRAEHAADAFNARAEAEGWPARCDASLQFRQPELNAFLGIWREKERLTGAPVRADFDARTLKAFLPHVWIQERFASEGAPVRYRVRLCGSAIAEIIGERTGRYVDEFAGAGTLVRWTAYNEAVIAAGAALRFVMPFQNKKVKYLEAECFMAPLACSEPAALLCATYFGPKSAVSVAAE